MTMTQYCSEYIVCFLFKREVLFMIYFSTLLFYIRYLFLFGDHCLFTMVLVVVVVVVAVVLDMMILSVVGRQLLLLIIW